MNLSSRRMSRSIGVDSFGAAPTMDQSLIFRYQPGGDLYSSIASSRGAEAADRIASAAATGSRERVSTAMGAAINGPNTGSTSTFVNFMQQVTSDPLKAPIAAALGQGSSGPGLGEGTTGKLAKSVMLIGAVALLLYGLNTAARLKG